MVLAEADKQGAHALIDKLKPEQIARAVDMLWKLADPVGYSLAHAPIEDEKISEEENRRAAEARLEGGSPSEQSKTNFIAEFGLTMEDWDKMGSEPLNTLQERH